MASRVLRSRQQSAERDEPRIRARWTNGLTKIFADLMVVEVQKGNRTSNKTFTKNAWASMCDEFYQKTGLKWDIERLKSRYSVMKKQHTTLKSLLSRSEFKLDESSGFLIASNDAWNDFLKGHPDAEAIRVSGCPFYKQLGIIFSDPITNGNHDLSVEQDGQVASPVPCVNPFKTVKEEESPPLLGVADEKYCSDSDDVSDYQERCQATPPQPTTCQPGTSVMDSTNVASRKRGRKGIEDGIARGIMQMAAASRLRTAAMAKVRERYSLADCIKELDAIQGLEERVYFAALDLFDGRNAREFFLSLKGDKRVMWLQSKCAVHSAS